MLTLHIKYFTKTYSGRYNVVKTYSLQNLLPSWTRNHLHSSILFTSHLGYTGDHLQQTCTAMFIPAQHARHAPPSAGPWGRCREGEQSAPCTPGSGTWGCLGPASTAGCDTGPAPHLFCLWPGILPLLGSLVRGRLVSECIIIKEVYWKIVQDMRYSISHQQCIGMSQ